MCYRLGDFICAYYIYVDSLSAACNGDDREKELEMMGRIAIFDFDGTLYRGDSFFDFSRFALGWPRLLWCGLKTMPWLAAWKLKLISGGQAKERLFGSLFRGMRLDDFARLGEEYACTINQQPQVRLNADVVAKLYKALNEGMTVVIATASISQWVAPWARLHGVNHVIATEVETDKDGVLTGRFSTANCQGEEKKRRLLEAIPDLEECETWGYGNMPDDGPMLSLVKHAEVVM